MLGTTEEVLYEGAGGNIEIPLDGLAAGMHIITVDSNGTTKTFKFVR